MVPSPPAANGETARAAEDEPVAAAPVKEPEPKPVAKPVAKAVAKAKPAAAATAEPTPVPPPAAAAGQWYLRTASGEQFGPATDDQFRQWITDRRVTPESYVWREGWADWQPAAQAAGELPAPLAVAPSAVANPGESAAARYQERRRKAAAKRSMIAIALLVLTLALGGVLAFILFGGGLSGGADDTLRESDKAATIEESQDAKAGAQPADDNDAGNEEAGDKDAGGEEPEMDDDSLQG